MSLRDSFWQILPGQFAGLRKPVDEKEVKTLLTYPENIMGIISLLDDEENLDMYRSLGIQHIHIPVKGGTSPTLDQLDRAIKFQADLSGLVVVHCSNGRRRTGTLLGAIYLRLVNNPSNIKSLDKFEIMKSRLLEVKPDCDLREAQWDWLKSIV